MKLVNPYDKGDFIEATKVGYYIFHHHKYKMCTLIDVDKKGNVIEWEGRPREAYEICKMGKVIAEKRTVKKTLWELRRDLRNQRR